MVTQDYLIDTKLTLINKIELGHYAVAHGNLAAMKVAAEAKTDIREREFNETLLEKAETLFHSMGEETAYVFTKHRYDQC